MPAGGWGVKENKGLAMWTTGNDATVDRDGRRREARGRVLPTLIRSGVAAGTITRLHAHCSGLGSDSP